MQFAYVYFMKQQLQWIRAVAPDHAGYWRGLVLLGCLGGPPSPIALEASYSRRTPSIRPSSSPHRIRSSERTSCRAIG
jgi:hypothetical protein